MLTAILTDNVFALALAEELRAMHGGIDVYQSPRGSLPDVPRLNVRAQTAEIIRRYGLVLSIHCKQLFPAELVRQVRCVNVHPGFNPYNRGWFPQVFSIINGLKAGVTIHEMDEQLDHGPIIAQREYAIESWDTSGSAYTKIMKLEREMVLELFQSIRDRTYDSFSPSSEGNINYKVDFDRLKALDMDEMLTLREFLNRLRALTHDEFRNAYFVDSSGRRVYVRVVLEPDDLERT